MVYEPTHLAGGLPCAAAICVRNRFLQCLRCRFQLRSVTVGKMVQFSSEDESATETDGTAASGSSSSSGGRGIPDSGRFFTVESANRLLPLVARIAQDLVALSRSLMVDSAQIRGIELLPRKSDIRSFNEELDCVKEAFRAESERLAEVSAELQQLGVVVDSIEQGVFDFPAFRDRRPIRLCWQIGESEIGYWHGVDESFSDRRPIDEL